VVGLNITYIKPITEDEIKLFKLMEEFMYTYLKDKSIFYKITLRFVELEDRANGLSYIGLTSFRRKEPYNPIIKISDYAVELSSNANKIRGHKCWNSYEKFRSCVIFHELAHLVEKYNDLEQSIILDQGHKLVFNKEEEDRVNKISREFLQSKGIIEVEGC